MPVQGESSYNSPTITSETLARHLDEARQDPNIVRMIENNPAFQQAWGKLETTMSRVTYVPNSPNHVLLPQSQDTLRRRVISQGSLPSSSGQAQGALYSPLGDDFQSEPHGGGIGGGGGMFLVDGDTENPMNEGQIIFWIIVAVAGGAGFWFIATNPVVRTLFGILFRIVGRVFI